jgi:Protein of unknown function (DUF2851)
MSPPLPLVARYERFRDDVFRTDTVAEPEALTWGEPMTELQLQSLWFAGEFGNAFWCTEEKNVVIRDFGNWNSGAGPDFTGCTVVIDGETLHGDIELDPDLRDWDRHNHATNPDYNQVVLHLFTTGPALRYWTKTAENKKIAQVNLRPDMLVAGAFRPSRIAAAKLGRCAEPLKNLSAGALADLIEAAAQTRLQRKAKRIHLCVSAHGREQAIYQSLAQTLGYRMNQRPFILISQRQPLRQLLQRSSSEREALLFGSAGFLEGQNFDDGADATRTYLRDLWEFWWKERTNYDRWAKRAFDINWNVKATRPGNHPQRRLGALASIVSNWPIVVGPLRQGGTWDRAEWCRSLNRLFHPYWTLHYTLTAAPAKRPIALIGDSRVQEILANVVYPLLIPDKPELWQEYTQMEAVLDNQKLRRATLRLFGDTEAGKVNQKLLFQQQGLLQIYEDFCLEDDSSCENCPFPERLLQWS